MAFSNTGLITIIPEAMDLKDAMDFREYFSVATEIKELREELKAEAESLYVENTQFSLEDLQHFMQALALSRFNINYSYDNHGLMVNLQKAKWFGIADIYIDLFSNQFSWETVLKMLETLNFTMRDVEPNIPSGIIKMECTTDARLVKFEGKSFPDFILRIEPWTRKNINGKGMNRIKLVLKNQAEDFRISKPTLRKINTYSKVQWKMLWNSDIQELYEAWLEHHAKGGETPEDPKVWKAIRMMAGKYKFCLETGIDSRGRWAHRGGPISTTQNKFISGAMVPVNPPKEIELGAGDARERAAWIDLANVLEINHKSKFEDRIQAAKDWAEQHKMFETDPVDLVREADIALHENVMYILQRINWFHLAAEGVDNRLPMWIDAKNSVIQIYGTQLGDIQAMKYGGEDFISAYAELAAQLNDVYELPEDERLTEKEVKYCLMTTFYGKLIPAELIAKGVAKRNWDSKVKELLTVDENVEALNREVKAILSRMLPKPMRMIAQILGSQRKDASSYSWTTRNGVKANCVVERKVKRTITYIDKRGYLADKEIVSYEKGNKFYRGLAANIVHSIDADIVFMLGNYVMASKYDALLVHLEDFDRLVTDYKSAIKTLANEQVLVRYLTEATGRYFKRNEPLSKEYIDSLPAMLD